MRHLPVLIAALLSCGDDEPELDPFDIDQPAVGPYDVQVRWTAYGVPHLKADDHGSLGFGIGYLTAQHHGCTYADQIVRVQGRRSSFLGPGPNDQYLDEDFGWSALDLPSITRRWWEALSEVGRSRLVGFAAGYNEALREGRFPESCRAEPWVQPISHLDAITYAVALGLDGSSQVFIREIGRAQPPGADALGGPAQPDALLAPSSDFQRALRAYDAVLRDPRRGSNGWVLGSDRSTEGGGLMLSNTHFPAWGEKRWFEMHLTVPGELDVYGASLIGVPVINIGFNEHVAWTHTVSYAPRFTAYALDLDPQDPTRYFVDGEPRAMTSERYTVEVLGDDGRTTSVTRTLWRSHLGPILDVPGVGWTAGNAVAVKDANIDNPGLFDVWHDMNAARSLDALVGAHRQHQGIPWVYTLAADRDGEVWFADTSRTPYITPDQWDAWQAWLAQPGLPQILARQFFDQAGALVLPASDPQFDWTVDLDARTPGITPPEQWPKVRRTDYAFNANDEPWLYHGTERLEDLLPVYGPSRASITARTRMNARYLHETGPDSASGADGLFSLETLEEAALSMRSALSEVALSEVVERCTGADSVLLDTNEVDLTEACAVLSAWDGRYTTDAQGAILWREFLAAFVRTQETSVFALNTTGAGLFQIPYDPDDPLQTPRSLVPAPVEGPDPVLQALAQAHQTLDAASIDPEATLGEVQRMNFLDGQDFAVPGGTYWEGTIGIADWSSGTRTAFPWAPHPGFADSRTGRTVDGRYLMNNGNSYILAVAYEPGGPRARAVMTYSQSTDPDSPHLNDQSPVYADNTLREVYFLNREVDEAAIEVEQLRRDGSRGFDE